MKFLRWANRYLFLSIGKTLQQLADANQREAEARQAKNIYNVLKKIQENIRVLIVPGIPGGHKGTLRHEFWIVFNRVADPDPNPDPYSFGPDADADPDRSIIKQK